MKAFDDYDNGRITRIAFSQVVDEVTEALWTAGYDANDDEEEVLFETDLDINDILDGDDSDDRA